MNSRNLNRGWIALFLTLFVWTSAHAQTQQRSTTRTGSQARSTTGSNSRSSGSSSSSGSTRTYNNNTMVGDATITSDPETRRIIVITDEETAVNISQVISNLDRPKPQVLIKVVFLEVALNDGSDIGFEGGYSKNIGNGQTVGVTNLFGLASQGATPGSPSLITTPGAGLYQVVGADFNATLRAIASAGKSQVLSRPSILVRNNQTATITVGQSVPLITGTTYTQNGNPINSYSYTDVGILLTVTPFITSDGLVQMIVAPETSSIDTATTGVSMGNGVFAPVINKRSANTVIVTPDRQTAVIGGLMQNSKQSLDSKIPFLGDIPYLGNLFKRKQNVSTKTELVIFLTPCVVAAPSRLAAISDKEVHGMDLAPKAFTEKELDKFLEGVPFKKPEKSKKESSKVKDSSK